MPDQTLLRIALRVSAAATCLLIPACTTTRLPATPTHPATAAPPAAAAPSPTPRPGSPAHARRLAVGGVHTCALTPAGGVRCWGDNHYGQLGNGTTTRSPTPVDVTNLSTGVIAITSGGLHTCALTAAGRVLCWGNNEPGHLGDGTTVDRHSPVEVSGLTGVTAISAGEYATCALTAAGAVRCWGTDFSRPRSDEVHTRPVEVPGASSGIAAVSAGYKHICVVTTGGAARCWGDNDHGQLGDGTTEDRLTPVDVTGLGSGVAAISAGDGYTCALLTTGAARCWGENDHGKLGDGTTDQRLAPVAVSALGSTVTSIAAAWWHTCAITTQGAVHCWGQNKYGELGGEPTAPRLAPSAVPGLEAGYTSVRPGKRYTCALALSGSIRCWGSNEFGSLGDPAGRVDLQGQ